MSPSGQQSRTSLSSARDSANTLAAPAARPASKSGFSSTATSLASTDGSERDLRSSGDGSLEKFKSRASSDGGPSETSSRRRMSNLFKKGRKSRRQSVHSDVPQADASVDAPPPLPLPQTRPLPRAREESEESLGLAKSVSSSLLTEDSDTEANPVRPNLSQHNSHSGYLTLSSPLISSSTVDLPSQDAGEPLSHAHTVAVANIHRSASPVGKLREAFSPERAKAKPRETRPGSSGGALGALFGGKPRKNTVLEDAVLHASPPQIYIQDEAEPVKRLPAPAPRRIITQTPATPPGSGITPATVVTPPTPTDAKAPASPASPASSKSAAKHSATQSNPNVVVSPSGNMISHRRARSATNPPSKLSNSIIAPLTPTPEEIKTPGGTALPPPPSSSGFFSSVFSAAQNAATSLSSTIANSTAGNKNKASNQAVPEEEKTGDAGGEEVIGPENAETVVNQGAERRRPAVETLGSGNLSLAELGITDIEEPVNMSKTEQTLVKAEDIAAAEAISAAYAKDTTELDDRSRSKTNASEDSGPVGAASPRQAEITDSPAPSSVHRQGSIRSRISGGRRRRHRGSSATMNTMAQSTATLAPPTPGPRLNGTGFAVAAPKRNRDFHNLFKSVPEDDYLIEDYSAALQREILLQGRLYVSEGHLCFSSNILGWVTNVVISFDEVVSVEKKSTAMLFPNGIVIQTLHARNVFASFLTRDATYDLIIGIWKISHPNLKSSLNGVTLGEGTGDKTEKAESIRSDDESIQDSDDEVYDEDEEEEGLGSFTEAGEGSIIGTDDVGSDRGGESRKTSQALTQTVGGGSKTADAGEGAAAASVTQDFPGPATHAPTDCGDPESHYDKLLIDTTIPAPLGKVYSMMFGPASGVWMRKWLIEDQKSTDLQMEDDKKGLGEDRKTFSYSYIKPLPGSIGPRQTKCLIKMDLEQYDLERAVTVLCSTQTPDVPSGNAFVTKTRYCLMWGPANSTRLIMTFTVEWSGKSWLKGPIEKGANDGQLTYSNAIATSLRTSVSAGKLVKAANGKPGKGKRRAQAPSSDDTAAAAIPEPVSAISKPAEPNWGPLDPIRPLISPLTDIFSSILSQKAFTGILLLLLLWSMLFRGPASGIARSGGRDVFPTSSAERIAAYEQIWRAEEAELWKWMEDRVAADRVQDVVGRRVSEAVHMQERLKNEGMLERQVDEALKLTEERLGVLKRVVEREKVGRTGDDKKGKTSS